MSWYREDDKMHKNPKWVRITALADDRFPRSSDKARALAKDAKLLQNVAGNWGAGNNCDGIITRAAVHQIAAEASMTFDEVINAAAVLTAAGFWIVLTKKRGGPGWEINDWLEYQPSRQQVERKATIDKLRKDLNRTAEGKRVAASVRRRDGDCCRYCNEPVSWTDRRSAHAGTYDHVDPALLQNTVENVVVSCRHCNIVKGDRTPDDAGMPLLPPVGTVVRDLTAPSHGQNAFRTRSNRAEGSGQVRTGQVGSDQDGTGRDGSDHDRISQHNLLVVDL
jgi:5-methylcytosine-specific restriction endonuclease McrA